MLQITLGFKTKARAPRVPNQRLGARLTFTRGSTCCGRPARSLGGEITSSGKHPLRPLGWPLL